MAQDKDHVGDGIQELLDGRLPAGTRREVEAHLEECERCRGEWQALNWPVGTLRSRLFRGRNLLFLELQDYGRKMGYLRVGQT